MPYQQQRLTTEALVEERVAWWLNPIIAKTQQHVTSETQEVRAVRLEKMNSTWLLQKPPYWNK